MPINRLASFSQRMAALTLTLIACMLILNAALWVFPILGSEDGLGLGFSLSGVMLTQLAVKIEVLAWWQILGAIVISSVPLIALASGLNHLRRLFQGYARSEYFSNNAAVHLGKVGRGGHSLGGFKFLMHTNIEYSGHLTCSTRSTLTYHQLYTSGLYRSLSRRMYRSDRANFGTSE